MTLNTQKETLGFQTEVKQLLHLMVHALYSNKEIFLRELISNASDAADKLRFESLSDSTLYENESELKIQIRFDEQARTITVKDNGIGMSRDEVITHLGTIAKSGTKEFLTGLSGDQKKDAHLIGQFGVGFYSVFIVADKVTVTTRRAGLTAEDGVQWESGGEGDYTIANIEKADRGTEVILHLKADENDFLNDWRLRNVIIKYSDHINLPIYMSKPVAKADKKDREEMAEETEKTPATEFEVVNRATALWTLPKGQVTDEQYQEHYKHIAHDFEEPLLWSHNKVEGNLEYTSLLYIPGRAPFDLWNRERQRGLKLYVQRVFIMDQAEQFVPHYLRFIRGVLDTNALPLNISREILQENATTEKLRIALTKRILDMLESLASTNTEKYAKFWTEFGKVLKEGPGEDFTNRERIAKLLRFSSTHTDSTIQDVSLEDYIHRMRPEQKKIYYVTADTFNAAKGSPHLEVFRKNNIEVLLLHDNVDEWLVAHLTEFAGKPLHSVAKGELDVNELSTEAKEKVKEQKQAEEQVKEEFDNIVNQVKEALKDQVKQVRITSRLTTSPACLVADENDMGVQLQRMLKAAGQPMLESLPILELNPDHPLIRKLKEETDDELFKEWAHLFFDQALLVEGGQLQNPVAFVGRMNKLLLN